MLMLKMSALKLFYRGHFLLLTQLILLNYPSRGFACIKHHSHKKLGMELWLWYIYPSYFFKI